MCGRFTLTASVDQLIETLQLDVAPEGLTPRYNVAPTQDVAAVRSGSGARELALLRWGLIPAWAKDPGVGSRMINARAETVAEKPAFRAALRKRRCLVPADGFYEWQRAGSRKQPIYFRLADESPFAFAGLWERWRAPDGAWVESCAIVTTESNELVRPVHDRMPVILPPTVFDLWLDPEVDNPGPLLPLLRSYPADRMKAVPVSLLVNSPRNDDPRCIEPLDRQGGGVA